MPKQQTSPARRGPAKPGSRPAPRRRGNPVLWMLPALAVALAIVIGVAMTARHRGPGPAGPAGSAAAAPPDVVHNLSQIPADTWNAVTAPDAYRPYLVALPHAADGPPAVLYIGAEYCPYCAVMRWPLAAALARFGTFSGLALSTSSATDAFPSTPTLTFLHTRYESPYISLQTVELTGNVQAASGGYPPLQHPTAAQEAVFRRLDPPGQIPFVLIGGQYLWTGSPFSPELLHGKSWQAIAASLPAGTTPAARAILAAANEISAAVCAVNGGSPAAVCRSAGVRAAAATLPTAGTR